MTYVTRSRRRPTPLGCLALAVLVTAVTAGIAGFADGDLLGDGTNAPVTAGAPVHLAARVQTPTARTAVVPAAPNKRDTSGATATDEGATHGGVSLFDESSASVANLDPDLLAALRRAAADADADGVRFVVNSGWRSAAYQESLLQDAIAKYGSKEEALRWVATPERSEHVSGDAVDLGPSKAATWLSRHGATYGLCRIYRNEPWHFELRPTAADRGCPRMYADPTHDPRMQP